MSMTLTKIHAPELAPGEWINTPRPIRLADWRGRVVVVDIWDFTCLNCLRTLPYLTAWQRSYRSWPVSFLGRPNSCTCLQTTQ